MRISILSIAAALLLYSCTDKSGNLKNEQDTLSKADTTKPIPTPDSSQTSATPEVKTNELSNTGKTRAELLQGKWQSTEDETNFLVFEGNHRKEIAAGMKDWDDETFVLSGKCTNRANKGDEIKEEKDSYISCENSDLCWYILEVNATSLSLSYMGRGNTLNYTRAD